MDESRRVVLGRVVGAHGLRGRLRVRLFGDGPENLSRASKVYVAEDPEDRGTRPREVASLEPGRPSEVRIALSGIEDRDAARGLVGCLVMVEADEIERLPEGEYYEYQLVGCRVEAEDGREIGIVRAVWPTGASDVLEVENEAGGRHLVPTGGDFLRDVDVEGRRIVIQLIPGLLDDA